MKKNKFILGFLCGALIFGSIGVFAASTVTKIEATFKSDLPIHLNGKKLTLENGSIFYNDTNYLSIREISEELTLDVYWNPETKDIELTSVDIVEYPVNNENNNNLIFAKNLIEYGISIAIGDGYIILAKSEDMPDSFSSKPETNDKITVLPLPPEENTSIDVSVNGVYIKVYNINNRTYFNLNELVNAKLLELK